MGQYRLLCLSISIHAPRAGGDWPVAGRTAGGADFNPRPPCGGRHRGLVNASDFRTFQSTPPVRGATRRSGLEMSKRKHFNPRPPCGGRLLKFEFLFGFSNNSCMVIRFLPRPAPCFKHTTNSTAFKAVFWCEPLRKSMCASPSHQRIILSSGKYAFLQPKCSILF